MSRKQAVERIPLCLALLAFAIPVLPVEAIEDPQDMSPEEKLEEVLSLRHGLIGPRGLNGPYDDNTQQLIKSVLDDPETYCPMVDQRLRLPDDPLALADLNSYLRLAAALDLAGFLGPEHCGDAVSRFFDDVFPPYQALRSAIDAEDGNESACERTATAKSNYDSLVRSSLRILSEFDDPRALDACMSMIESLQPDKRDGVDMYVMLKYMAKVAPQRPACRAELMRMYEDRASRLYQQPRLKQVIDAIDARAAAEGTDKPDS